MRFPSNFIEYCREIEAENVTWLSDTLKAPEWDYS